ncbi:MAG: filamentous hemagglutinin N-terminal domain-containing protein [Thiotrichaceae bacterium]|nr:filamentous hemagglutinin N-terminal domain-containing protein [Thiotrichaceae bacterium]
MRLQNSVLILLILLLININAIAVVTTDNTMGTVVAHEGTDFIISDGDRRESNIFHSFDEFSIDIGETAIFSNQGYEQIQINNIFSRVTNGYESVINGGLISEIPNADLYLLNPAGFLIGADAYLDIQGSLYLSGADYVRFDDDKRFYSQLGNESQLTTASPAAFGFLEGNQSYIDIEEYYPQDEITLVDSLFLISGDIDINNDSLIHVPSGKIGLIATKTGEVLKNRAGEYINIREDSKLGSIDINFSEVLASGIQEDNELRDYYDLSGNGGQIYIRAEEFTMDGSLMASDMYEDADTTGLIDIQADKVHLTRSSEIFAENYSEIKGSSININAQEITSDYIAYGSIIEDIKEICTYNTCTTKSGELISCSGTECYAGYDSTFDTLFSDEEYNNLTPETIISKITCTDCDSPLSPEYFNQEITDYDSAIGDIINICTYDTCTTKFDEPISCDGYNCYVNSSDFEIAALFSGEELDNLTPDILIDNITCTDCDSPLSPLDFQLASNTINTVNHSNFDNSVAGDINITTPYIELNNGMIEASTDGAGNAGSIKIATNGNGGEIILNQSYITASVGYNSDYLDYGIKEEFIGLGNAGDIDIDTSYLLLSNQSVISSSAELDTKGSAGKIDIEADYISLRENSSLYTFNDGTGSGGLINITANKILAMTDSNIISASFEDNGGSLQIVNIGGSVIDNSYISTRSYDENAGNINLSSEQLVFLKDSEIDLGSIKGDGGNIRIKTESMLNENTTINTSSVYGETGKIQIDAEEELSLENLALTQLEAFKMPLDICSRVPLINKENSWLAVKIPADTPLTKLGQTLAPIFFDMEPVN